MSLTVQRTLLFTADFEKQFAWHLDKAGVELAWRFQAALDISLHKLSNQSDLGRPRHFRNPKLRNLRSYPVERPFNRLLIFYRVEGGNCKPFVLCTVLATCPGD